MLNKLQELIWNVWCEGGAGRFWKIVFFYLLAVLMIGFLAAALLIIGHEMTIVGHPGLFVFLLVLFAGGIGFGGLFLFRQILYGMLRDRLVMLELQGGTARSVIEHALYRLSLKDLAARVRELLQEDVIAAGSTVRRRHVVAGQYGFGVPGSQMEKILEDEGFYGLYGRTREAFVLVTVCHFPASAVVAMETEPYHELFQAVLKKNLDLSKKTGFLLAEFSPRIALLCSDLPYATAKKERRKLFDHCSQWQDAVAPLVAGLAADAGAAVVLHYGTVHAGLVPAGDAAQYSIIGPAVAQAHDAVRGTSGPGLFVSPAALAQLGIASAPEGWQMVLEDEIPQ